MQRSFFFFLVLILTACGSGMESPLRTAKPAPAEPVADLVIDNAAASTRSKKWTRGGMVSAANPLAAAAAKKILVRGGHAVDAAIAAHAVLGLVEPQSSGIGGSTFMLVYEHNSGQLAVYDGRETAPAAATADLFLRDGEAMGFLETWQAGIAIGIPGTVAAYQLSHDQHGKLPWADLFAPAISLATKGFAVSPRMHNSLAKYQGLVSMDDSPAMAQYLYPGGKALPVGFVRDNPAYANTLSLIADGGGAAFYRGPVADAFLQRAQQAPLASSMTQADIGAYQAISRNAVCGAFRAGQICSAPPPSSGMAHIMIAALYDELRAADSASLEENVRVFVDAQRLAYADRDRYIADPNFVQVPLAELTNPVYLKHRATQRFAPAAQPTAGDPVNVVHQDAAASNRGRDSSAESAGTSHLSIIDTYGNAVSMTASVGAPFGSFRLSGGFLLNNQISDFARTPVVNGEKAANVVEPGKRPRSSMSPTMVFNQDGDLKMITGSPGGNSILAYTTKTIIAILDWGYTAQEAVDFPNIVARGPAIQVEAGDPVGQRIATYLTEQGYDVKERRGENSGIHLIVVHPDHLEGAADKRREGVVAAVPGTQSQ